MRADTFNRRLVKLLGGLTVVGLLFALPAVVRAIADDERPGSISGILVNRDGAPLPNFAISLQQKLINSMDPAGGKLTAADSFAGYFSELKLIATTQTDDKGNFKFDKVAPGAYLLTGGGKNIGYLYQRVSVQPAQETALGNVAIGKKKPPK